MIIFDTDTVTLLGYGHAKVTKRVKELPDEERLAVTVITQMQILRGRYESVLKAANESELKTAMQRFQESERLLATFLVLPVDAAAAEQFEKLRTSKSKKLKAIGRPDLLIACVALAEKALLVSRNLKDFKEVPGLQVENWAD